MKLGDFVPHHPNTESMICFDSENKKKSELLLREKNKPFLCFSVHKMGGKIKIIKIGDSGTLTYKVFAAWTVAS